MSEVENTPSCLVEQNDRFDRKPFENLFVDLSFIVQNFRFAHKTMRKQCNIAFDAAKNLQRMETGVYNKKYYIYLPFYILNRKGISCRYLA